MHLRVLRSCQTLTTTFNTLCVCVFGWNIGFRFVKLAVLKTNRERERERGKLYLFGLSQYALVTLFHHHFYANDNLLHSFMTSPPPTHCCLPLRLLIYVGCPPSPIVFLDYSLYGLLLTIDNILTLRHQTANYAYMGTYTSQGIIITTIDYHQNGT